MFIVTVIVQTTVNNNDLCIIVNTYTKQFMVLLKMWYIKFNYDHLYHMIKIYTNTCIYIVFMKAEVIMFDFQVIIFTDTRATKNK